MTTGINSDFGQRIVIRPSDYRWVESHMPGRECMTLDRTGDAIARAAAIVRFAPFCEISSPDSAGGEEIFVLDGVLCDESQSYEKGSYFRNPIGSSNTPRAGKEGATVFAKQHQFSDADKEQKMIDTQAQPWYQGVVDGLTVMPLHEFENEHVALVKWESNTQFSSHRHWGGEEILVLEGTFHDEYGSYPKGSWLRSPHLSQHNPYTKEDGALIYVKTGHL